MNSALIQILGDCLPPPCGSHGDASRSGYSNAISNSFTVSGSGQLAFLCSDGKIKLCSIRHPVSDAVSDLEVHGLSQEDASGFTSMEFSSDGNAILLWGVSRVGFIELPASAEGIGSFTSLINVTTVEDGPCHPIVKASFHPLCNHCVVILHQQEHLRLVDLRSNSSQVLSLTPGRIFCSFTFGPAIDWLQFSIILLSNTGDVYTLCPIIPSGTVVSASTVASLWAWADQLEYENDPDNRMVEDYLCNLHSYLSSTFGPRPLSDEDVHGDSYLRAGESHAGEFSSESIDNDDTVVRSLSNYLPMLVGPLSFIRPTETGRGSEEPEGGASIERKQSEPADRQGGACDICTPTGTGSLPASYSSSNDAPVVIMSYRSGTVDVVIFDPDSKVSMESRHGVSHCVHTASYIGPSWRSIDRSRAGLMCGGAGLMVAETVNLPVANEKSEELRRKSFWCIKADPVHHHLVHVSSSSQCEAFLLSLTWLEKLMEEEFRQQSIAPRVSLSSADSIGELVDPAPLCATPATHPTKVLPVFVLPPGAAEETSRVDGVEVEQVCLSGAVVLQDAMLGHVALFRTTTGLVSAVNLTVHTKLCELQESLHYNSGGVELLPMKLELDRATSAEHLRWKRAQQCLHKVAEGLKAMPEMDAATAAALTPQASPHNKKVLLEAAQKLEKDVIVPLNELSQTVAFSYEMVQEAYRSQLDILEGSSNSRLSGSLSQGLCKLVHNLDEERAQLSDRVKKIQDKFAAQRDRAEEYLAFAVSQRAKMTRAENLYKRQLEDWSRVVSQMNEQVSALRVLSTAAGSTPSTPSKGSSLPRSPRAGAGQPPLFSLTTTNNVRGEVASPSAARFLRSPVGATNYQSASSPSSAASGSILSPTPSKNGGAAGSRVFQSPHTPNAFRSLPGQAGGRPYSTPSTSTPTPSGVNSNTANQSRLYHTRHPPMATPSPNFYASYRSSTLGSAGTNPEQSTVGATGASMRTARSLNNSQVGSPAPTGTNRAHSAVGVASLSTGAPIITLSSEDQEACAQLLLSQTELLEKAQRELAGLEEKLKSVREHQRI